MSERLMITQMNSNSFTAYWNSFTQDYISQKTYSLYESLSPESKTYNQVEYTIFVLDEHRYERKLKYGLTYVKSTL